MINHDPAVHQSGELTYGHRSTPGCGDGPTPIRGCGGVGPSTTPARCGRRDSVGTAGGGRRTGGLEAPDDLAGEIEPRVGVPRVIRNDSRYKVDEIDQAADDRAEALSAPAAAKEDDDG